jgi:hypothetical protein
MDDHIVKLISTPFTHQSAHNVVTPSVEIASMHWDNSGILIISIAPIVRNHSTVVLSLNTEGNLIAKLIITNRLVLFVLVVENQSLEDASMLSIRNGIRNTLCVHSV